MTTLDKVDEAVNRAICVQHHAHSPEFYPACADWEWTIVREIAIDAVIATLRAEVAAVETHTDNGAAVKDTILALFPEVTS